MTKKKLSTVTLILKKINDITRNQLIIDAMLLIQGVNFLIHPQTAHKGIIESLSLAVFFVAVGIIIGFIVAHGFRRHNFRTILLALIFAVISVITYLNAGQLAPAFHYFIALAIILNGFLNILSTYRLTKLTHARKIIENKINTGEAKDQTVQGVATVLKNTTKLEAERILSPTVFLSEKVAKFRYGQLFINLLLIIIGAMMLFFRFDTNEILIRISGGILIFSAMADLVALLWTHRESSFVKEFTHFNTSHKNQ